MLPADRPMDTAEWGRQGVPAPAHELMLASEEYIGGHGIQLLNTCTPYQVGIVPGRHRHPGRRARLP